MKQMQAQRLRWLQLVYHRLTYQVKAWWRFQAALIVANKVMSAISDGGNWVIKGVATGNSKGHFGATIGAGYQW